MAGRRSSARHEDEGVPATAVNPNDRRDVSDAFAAAESRIEAQAKAIRERMEAAQNRMAESFDPDDPVGSERALTGQGRPEDGIRASAIVLPPHGRDFDAEFAKRK